MNSILQKRVSAMAAFNSRSQKGISRSALSQHLARLREDKLVRMRRQAQCIYYSLAKD